MGMFVACRLCNPRGQRYVTMEKITDADTFQNIFDKVSTKAEEAIQLCRGMQLGEVCVKKEDMKDLINDIKPEFPVTACARGAELIIFQLADTEGGEGENAGAEAYEAPAYAQPPPPPHHHYNPPMHGYHRHGGRGRGPRHPPPYYHDDARWAHHMQPMPPPWEQSYDYPVADDYGFGFGHPADDGYPHGAWVNNGYDHGPPPHHVPHHAPRGGYTEYHPHDAHWQPPPEGAADAQQLSTPPNAAAAGKRRTPLSEPLPRSRGDCTRSLNGSTTPPAVAAPTASLLSELDAATAPGMRRAASTGDVDAAADSTSIDGSSPAPTATSADIAHECASLGDTCMSPVEVRRKQASAPPRLRSAERAPAPEAKKAGMGGRSKSANGKGRCSPAGSADAGSGDASASSKEAGRTSEETFGAADEDPRYKTKLCARWTTDGGCYYAGSCGFAHGDDELREAPAVKAPTEHVYKTVMCRNWETDGQCPRTDKCNFAHGSEDLRKPHGARRGCDMSPKQQTLKQGAAR